MSNGYSEGISHCSYPLPMPICLPLMAYPYAYTLINAAPYMGPLLYTPLYRRAI